MKTKVILYTSLVLLFLSTNTLAEDKVLYEAHYEGKISGLTVKMRKKLIAKENERYQIESRAENFLGSIKEDSHFLTHQGRIIPLSYRDTRKLLGRTSDRRLTFDWKNELVHFRRKDKPKKNRDYAIVEGILDPALYQLKLQQEAFALKDNLSFSFAKDYRIKTMEFSKKDDTKYHLSGRDYKAIRYERKNTEGKKNTLVTLIPELDYMIAKIVHTEKDGSEYTISLKKSNHDSEALKHFYKSLMPLAS